jgi:glycosyltransferase involved in cell wall biosynthesis
MALLKVLHLTTVPSTLIFLRGQASFMRRHGVELCAISSPGPELTRFGEEEGIAVAAVEMSRRISPVSDLFALRQLAAQIRRFKPDIVHSHTPKAGLLGVVAASLVGVPVRIYQVHGLPFMTATGFTRHLLRLTESVASSLASEVLFVSPSIRRVAIDEGLCDADVAVVLGQGSVNGVEAAGYFNPARYASHRREVRQRYGIPPEATVIGFVGRLVKDKGINELLACWQSLRSKRSDLHMILAGPFEERDAVHDSIRVALLADPNIHMVGANYDIAPFYSAMDVLVLPTHREGLGMVLLEAGAMELPVVSSRIPGCVDAVADGVTGTLVEPGDACRLALAVRRYLDDPELRKAHGCAGRRRVLDAFDPDLVREATYNEYARLVGATT